MNANYSVSLRGSYFSSRLPDLPRCYFSAPLSFIRYGKDTFDETIISNRPIGAIHWIIQKDPPGRNRFTFDVVLVSCFNQKRMWQVKQNINCPFDFIPSLNPFNCSRIF